ncbi:hypothetical protein [Gloeobacter morelensis]|uniref:hypothetical protein n=1 Tax=Gloeobacter morelensis TaxID=2907343 RepID=UPI001E61E94D|nr:hypothetical protein [Gloeobacter morelensis]UFP97238.1 hypothetical protein ISF26_24255 [Gloeobacter morelensis MG652769]
MIGSLVQRQVASKDQLLRLVYVSQGLNQDTFNGDFEYLQQKDLVTAVDLLGRAFYMPTGKAGMAIGRSINTPRTPYKMALRAFLSELAAQTAAAGGEWIEQARKQLKLNCGREVSAFRNENGLRLVVPDPTFERARELARLGGLLILAHQRLDSLRWELENTVVIRATELL